MRSLILSLLICSWSLAADTVVEFVAPPGMTLTLETYALGSDSQTSTDSATEATNREGTYTATVSEALAGVYHATIVDASGNGIASGYVDLVDDTGTYRVMADYGSLASVQNTENDTALSDIGLDHLVGASVTGTDVTDDSIIAFMVSKSATADWDSFTNTTDALEALGDAAAPTAAAIADAVLQESVDDHKATANSLAEHMDAIQVALGVAGAGLTAVPWNAAWDTEIDSAVATGLATTTYAEPGQGAPPATATLEVKVGYLYKAWRNKITQTNTTYSLFNDDASTVDHKATVSDSGGTFTRTEVGTGP